MTNHGRVRLTTELTPRQRQVLRAVVEDYLSTAVPVGSESLVRRYGLDVSSATVRSAMAELEALGLLTHPHTSAGRTPSDMGYRVFVESLMRESELDHIDQLMIRHQFSQVQLSTNEWLRLAASILATSTGSAAVVTPARARRARYGHAQLVELADRSRLLVVVLGDGKVVQRKLDRAAMDRVEPGTSIGQRELDAVAGALNAMLAGMTATQVRNRVPRLRPLAAYVAGVVADELAEQGEPVIEELFTDGLVHVLEQPEFARGRNGRRVIEALQRTDFIRRLFPVVGGRDGVHVIIGRENQDDAMHEVSLVFAPYGAPERALGLLGVLGPTRMPYARAIPTVRYLSVIMNELIQSQAASHERTDD